MSFWGNEKWLLANEGKKIVDGFCDKFLRDGCYRLGVGDHAMVSSTLGENADPMRRLDDKNPLTLQPGQFAHLITEEAVHLPDETIGFINVATKTKIRGLVNISGFHVDPLYSGKLIFTVFNAGPTALVIPRGERIFRLWLSDFSGKGGQSETKFDRIPPEWAERLHGTYPSPFALANRVSELEVRIDEVKAQRSQLLIALVIAGLFLLPFVASLYASIHGPLFVDQIKARIETNKKILEPSPSSD
jgi:dCTP deaminase